MVIFTVISGLADRSVPLSSSWSTYSVHWLVFPIVILVIIIIVMMFTILDITLGQNGQNDPCTRSMTREESAENGKEFAIAANCYQRQDTWLPEQVF